MDAHGAARSHLAGVCGGVSAGRLGVRTCGGPPGPGVRQTVAAAPGERTKPPVMVVRIRGYGIAMGSAQGNYAALRAELPSVFGPDSRVTVRPRTR